MPTSGQHNDFRRNVDLPKVDKIDSKHSEDVSAELELCKDKLKQLEEEIRVLRTEKLKQDKKMAEQELEIERLRERNNSEALDEKKQELLAEF